MDVRLIGRPILKFERPTPKLVDVQELVRIEQRMAEVNQRRGMGWVLELWKRLR